MATLVISTNQGINHEAEVRDYREANHEMARFNRLYLANHPNDTIINAVVIARGNIISRYHNGSFEAF